MKVTYDPGTDTIIINLKDVQISESDEFQEGMIADLDSEERIVGFAILAASKRVTERQNMIFESRGHGLANGATDA
ncbi:MAG: hypothetical protein BZY80_01310 [SAR202 cluster bacterium Io17-Chloro-G2]|nr:MAG: hypothetical protein BZY80_01310 [SAR202 cluster bacterium Io17-Chloro-G2]